jgi:hypothetical protein
MEVDLECFYSVTKKVTYEVRDMFINVIVVIVYIKPLCFASTIFTCQLFLNKGEEK